jgi:hypothetical protein
VGIAGPLWAPSSGSSQGTTPALSQRAAAGTGWRVGAVSSCGLGAGETAGGGNEVQASGPLGDGQCAQSPDLDAGAGEPG